MVKIYTAQRMTGRYCDEMRTEADMLVRTLSNYGFQALNPVVEENIPYVHELLPAGSSGPWKLEEYWRRDKEMIREADILLDYDTQNRSDGANKEIAYARYCLWKPTVRVWNGPGGSISKLEDDLVVPSLADALLLIQDKWGTYEKLGTWRDMMWRRSFSVWFDHQRELRKRYGMDTKPFAEV